jgi:hypothetical protein
MTSPWQPPDQTPPAAAPPPQPRYGEMAPPGYVSPVPTPPQEHGAPTYYATAPVVRKSRPADVAITSVLLALGLIGLLIGLAAAIGLERALSDQAAQYGVTYHAPANLGALSAFIAISHIVLFLAALGASIPLLITRRLAFWVPLVAGVVAAIIFWGVLFSLIFSDQALVNAITSANH